METNSRECVLNLAYAEIREIVTGRGLLPDLLRQGRTRMMALLLNNEEKEMLRHFRKRLQRRQRQTLEEKMLEIAMPKPLRNRLAYLQRCTSTT